MTIAKHYCYLENDPNTTDPPEYFIPGATAVPVIRGKHGEARSIHPLDNRRRTIKTISLNDSVDIFSSLLFSNEIFSIDSYNPVKIMSLIDESIDKFNYKELVVHLIFHLDDDGTCSLSSKRFLNDKHEPFCFENNLSSTIRVAYKESSYQSNMLNIFKDRFKLTDYSTKKTYKETVYRAEYRYYTDIIVNCYLDDVIAPLVIAYDEFGVLYTDYYYDHERISPYILNAIKPHFDDKVGSFDYFNQNETNALKMLWM